MVNYNKTKKWKIIYMEGRIRCIVCQTNDVVWHLSDICVTYDRHKNDVFLTNTKNVRRTMENDRITIRLPQIDLRQIDLLIRLGEFSTRSEVIRHAVKEYIENHTTRILAKADKIKKIQELEAAAAAIEPYMKK
jgi:Arc/MetJ-type ribon-helix-helix transcriptional regulator